MTCGREVEAEEQGADGGRGVVREESLLSSSRARREEHGGVGLGDWQEGARRRGEHGSRTLRRAPSATGGQ